MDDQKSLDALLLLLLAYLPSGSSVFIENYQRFFLKTDDPVRTQTHRNPVGLRFYRIPGLRN
ncbi:MAG: hypothetical protein QF675_05895, partial [SAR324 cluster bacterium]|nr:hypothetical protein [SAR324 cluster bacterium]